MTARSLPDYPNLFELEEIKITKIEKKCQKVGHLDNNEKLLDRISDDLNILKQHNLTKEEIYINHRNMYLKFNKTDEFDQYTCDDKQDLTHCAALLQKLPKGFGNGWSMWSKTTNEITLNGQHLRISCFVWGGAEECQIEKSFANKYNGYSRGDRDWFVTNLGNNKNIWIPDLLPAQIGMFGFCQSPSSNYRLDPNHYIEVMGMVSPIMPLITHVNKCWSRGSGPFSLESSLKDVNTTSMKEINTEQYHAIACTKNDKECLLIHFKDENYVRSNNSEKIIVFELELCMDEIFNTNDYTSFSVCEDIILDERDDSEKIREKSRSGNSCSIQ